MHRPLLPEAFSNVTRRGFLSGSAALGATAFLGPFATRAVATPLITVETTTIEVNGKPAMVFAVRGPDGGSGVFAKEGDRLFGGLLNASDTPLVMHWHGQILAPPEQDRARPGGGELVAGGTDVVTFELTPGTHWMHSHTLSEQQLLAAPLITREADAGDVQDVVVMLHDFSFRSPQEILAGLGGSNAYSGHGTPMPGTGGAGTMVHANDVAYDAFLANMRTLADPQVFAVEKSGRVRLRIINGATATAFFISTPGLDARCIAVDGSPCEPLPAASFPLAQGQRLDLLVDIPAGGGAFPVLAQVENTTSRTGVVLATKRASVARLSGAAERPQGLLDLDFEARLVAAAPLDAKAPDRVFPVMLGEEPGYRWTINGRVHGEDTPFEVKSGERVEMTFLNPTGMMHPMHLHGHHFQVVGIDGRRFSGPVRDTVIVPPHMPVTIAFDAGQNGEWHLHCHHLYHMATGMMGVVKVT